jgi:hypothetical protein
MAFQLFPSFSFFEGNVGPRPVRPATVDRVALAGVFRYGPAGVTVADANDALKLFGADTSVGSVHMQAVLDQGVNDILISRVLPAARKAKVTLQLVGTAAGDGSIGVEYAVAGGVATTLVSDTDFTGKTASEIVADLVALVADTDGLPFTAAVGTASGTTGSIVFTAAEAGDAGNDIVVGLSVSGHTGLTVPADAELEGGFDAPQSAQVTLQAKVGGVLTDVLRLVELSPGTAANGNTKVEVVRSLDADKFSLILTNAERGITETFSELSLADVYDEDKFAPLRSSMLARGVVLDEAGQEFTEGVFSFTGGHDGDPTLTTEDFIRAIDAYKAIQATFIICPGLKPDGVDQWALNATLVAQAEAGDAEMGEMVGLRQAILSAPRGTTQADLPGLRAASRIPDSQRTVMVVGWGSSARQTKARRFSVDPAALYAGHCVVTPAHISTAARTSSPTIKGITELDTPATVSAWNDITRYRCEALIADPVSGAFHCLNGRTTASDPAWYWNCVRRIYDTIRTDIFFNFQFTKSEPSNAALDATIQQGIDAYLGNRVANRQLAGYDPTVSNDSNNPPAVRASGQRYVDIFIEPLYPNDKTQFNINRVLRASIRLA